jgi:hypothetical protein
VRLRQGSSKKVLVQESFTATFTAVVHLWIVAEFQCVQALPPCARAEREYIYWD